MTTSNGFPTLHVHDAMDIWKLGNMAYGWAKQPLALDSSQVEMFVDLCRRYSLEPAVVLMEFQRIAFPHISARQVEEAVGVVSDPDSGEMPEISGAGVPAPSPHPRTDEPTLVQPAIGSVPRHAESDPLPAMMNVRGAASCGLLHDHEPHHWEEGNAVEGWWNYCDGSAAQPDAVEDAPDDNPGEWYSEDRDAP